MRRVAGLRKVKQTIYLLRLIKLWKRIGMFLNTVSGLPNTVCTKIKLEEDKSVEVPPAAIQEQRLGVLLGTRNGGEYKNKSFYLNNSLYNWEIKTDSMGTLCLIPTKK